MNASVFKQVTRGALLVAFLSPAASHASVSLSLVPDAPGPYSPGETIGVEVFLVNEGEGQMQMRLMQMDTALTDPALTLGEFDFHLPLPQKYTYGDFSSGTVINRTFTATCGIPCHLDFFEGANLLATTTVTLPDEIGAGNYVLDLLNPLAPDNNTGASFQWDFEDTQQAWSGDGTLKGGRMEFPIGMIPEPATGLLLLAGASAIARRRRRGAGHAVGAT